MWIALPKAIADWVKIKDWVKYERETFRQKRNSSIPCGWVCVCVCSWFWRKLRFRKLNESNYDFLEMRPTHPNHFPRSRTMANQCKCGKLMMISMSIHESDFGLCWRIQYEFYQFRLAFGRSFMYLLLSRLFRRRNSVLFSFFFWFFALRIYFQHLIGACVHCAQGEPVFVYQLILLIKIFETRVCSGPKRFYLTVDIFYSISFPSTNETKVKLIIDHEPEYLKKKKRPKHPEIFHTFWIDMCKRKRLSKFHFKLTE